MTIGSDVSNINNCETKADWTGVNHSNPDDNNTGSATPIFREGSGCMQATAGKQQDGSWYDDNNVDLSDTLLVWWFWMSGPTEIGYLDNLDVRLYETAGQAGDSGFWVQDLTALAEGGGGWTALRVWATQPDTESGTFVAADTSNFTLRMNNADTNFDIKLVGWDYLHSISELTASAQTADFDDFVAHDLANNLGVFEKVEFSYTAFVRLEIGAASTTTTFVETAKTLQFLPLNSDQKIYFDFIAGTATSFTLGALVSGNPVNGCLIQYDAALSGATDSSDIFNNPNNCNTFKLYDTTINNARTVHMPTASANREVLGCKFANCGQVEANTVEFEDNIIVNADDRGVLMVASTGVKNCQLIGCGHAIHISTAGTYTFDNLQFSGNTFDIENSANATTVDSYADSNRDGDQQLGNGTILGVAQSFDGGITTRTLSNARFFLSKTGTPTGNAVANLYAISGAIGGGDDIPTGAALATSDNVDVSTLTGTPTLTQFNFQDEISIVSGTDYVISIEYSGGDGSNHVLVGRDSSSPSHTGNMATLTGSTWSAVSGTDAVFFVSGDGLVIVNSSNGSNHTTFENTGAPPGGTVLKNSVAILIKAIDAITSANIQNARVYLTAADGGPLTEGTEILTPASQLTNVSGEVSETFNYTADQPVTGRVRRSTSSPLYKNSPISGTITTNGLSLTAPLVKDE